MWSLGAQWAQQQAEQGKRLSAQRPRQLLNCGRGKPEHCHKDAPDSVGMDNTAIAGCASSSSSFSHPWQRLPGVDRRGGIGLHV